jgi:hypothetical protein
MLIGTRATASRPVPALSLAIYTHRLPPAIDGAAIHFKV